MALASGPHTINSQLELIQRLCLIALGVSIESPAAIGNPNGQCKRDHCLHNVQSSSHNGNG